MALVTTDPAAEAYDALAAHYDVLTQSFPHQVWLERLEALALDQGLRGRRLLDVACGTGKSFAPLYRRGYDVTGCDISAGMLAAARGRVGPDVTLVQADVRSLPAELGPFDLVTWVDDAVNYLLGDGDLEAAVVSIAGTLAPGGVVVFDANTLASHRRMFSLAYVVENDDVFLCWHGEELDEDAPGLPARASVEIFQRGDPDGWTRRRSDHCQRWWGEQDVRAACESAGLTLVAVRGQHKGAILDLAADEETHHKIVYVLRKGPVRG